MPEDQELEISEHETDTEGEAGFDEFSEGEYVPDGEVVDENPAKPEKKKAEPKPEEEPAETEDKGEDEKTDEKPTEEPEKELSAKEAIEARIKEIETPLEGEDKTDKEKPGEAAAGKEAPKPDDKGPAKPGKLTKEQLAFHMNVISDDELPDEEIIIGDQTFNFKELREDDPEAYNAMKVMASMAGAKYLNAALQSGKLVSAEAVQKIQEDFNTRLADIGFWFDLSAYGHADALQIVKSKGYQDWVAKQNPGVKKLADSPEIEDAVKVLNYYKEEVAQGKVDAHDSKLRDKKKRRDDMLMGTIDNKPAGPGKKATGKADDEAAFDEEAGK